MERIAEVFADPALKKSILQPYRAAPQKVEMLKAELKALERPKGCLKLKAFSVIYPGLELSTANEGS